MCQSTEVVIHDKEDEPSSSVTEEFPSVFDEALTTMQKSDTNQSTRQSSSSVSADVRTQQSVSIMITDTSNSSSNIIPNLSIRENTSTSNVTLTPNLHNEAVQIHDEGTQR